VKRRPTQKQIEAAHRIRVLSNGGAVPDATPAERHAAAKRNQEAKQRRREQEATGE
jgi:hypothetical protein